GGPGPVLASVKEDGNVVVTGQLTATDPDDGDTQTWSLVGGTSVRAPAYHFAIDELTAVKNGTTIFDDSFDGTAPPGGPQFVNPANTPNPIYLVTTGTFSSDNGEADLDGSGAAFAGWAGPRSNVGNTL